MRRRETTRRAAEAAALVRSGKVAAPKHRARTNQSDLFAAIGTKAPMPEHIEPCKPTLVSKAPTGPEWLHESKFDGYRLMAFLNGGRTRLDTKSGLDWSHRFPGVADALAALPVESAILDGGAVVEVDGLPDFGALQAALGGRAGTRAAGEVDPIRL